MQSSIFEAQHLKYFQFFRISWHAYSAAVWHIACLLGSFGSAPIVIISLQLDNATIKQSNVVTAAVVMLIVLMMVLMSDPIIPVLFIFSSVYVSVSSWQLSLMYVLVCWCDWLSLSSCFLKCDISFFYLSLLY